MLTELLAYFHSVNEVQDTKRQTGSMKGFHRIIEMYFKLWGYLSSLYPPSRNILLKGICFWGWSCWTTETVSLGNVMWPGFGKTVILEKSDLCSLWMVSMAWLCYILGSTSLSFFFSPPSAFQLLQMATVVFTFFGVSFYVILRKSYKRKNKQYILCYISADHC